MLWEFIYKGLISGSSRVSVLIKSQSLRRVRALAFTHRLSTTTMSKSPEQPPVYKLRLRGEALLTSPRWNKGTAFTEKERQSFGLTGRLPYTVNTLEHQCQRAYDQLKSQDNDLQKNAFLQSLKEQNFVLYYGLLERHLTELMPIIYTPTEVRVLSLSLNDSDLV